MNAIRQLKRTGILALTIAAVMTVGGSAVQAATIIDLTPTSGNTTAKYSQLYDFNGGNTEASRGFDLSNPDITFNNIVIGHNEDVGTYYIVDGANQTGSLTFDFDTDASADGLSLSSVSIYSHSYDFGNDDASTIGEWSTDGGSNWTKFYDTLYDGNGVLTDTLSGTGISGATALKIRYTTTTTNNQFNQQIFGVRGGTIESWTHLVEATYIPEPSTIALFVLPLAGLFLRRRRRR